MMNVKALGAKLLWFGLVFMRRILGFDPVLLSLWTIYLRPVSLKVGSGGCGCLSILS